MEEKWRDIKKIWSKQADRFLIISVSNHGNFRLNGQEIEPIRKDGLYYLGRYRVDELVAEAFIPNFNPDTDTVIHKDKHQHNSNIDNLTVIKKEDLNKQKYGIARCDLNGNILQVERNANTFHIKYGYDNSCISRCIKGKFQQYKGFLWKKLEQN